MRIVKAIKQSILHPRSPKKRRLWGLALLALFCIVSFWATGAPSSSAFAASHTPSQQGGSLKGKNNLLLPADSPTPPEIPIQTDCATPQTGATSAADCTNFQQNQTNAGWNPAGQNIQNPIAANSPLLFFTDPAYTTDPPPVGSLWKAILYIVDAFMIISLMFNSILIMLGGSVFRYSKAIESFPGILLALIVAHISMTFITLILGLNNTLSHGLYNWTQGSGLKAANTTITKQYEFYGFVGQPYPLINTDESSITWKAVDNKISGYSVPPVGAVCWHDPSQSTPVLAPYLLLDCTWPEFTITPQSIDFTKMDLSSMMKTIPGALDLMIDVMGLMLLAQVVIRIFFIDLYIVFAPLGIACWAMPANAGRGVTSMWFKGFISTVFVQFVQMTAIIVLQLILSSLMGYLTGSGGINAHVLSSDILDKVVNVAFLWFIFRLPSMFNTAPMRSMVEIGQTMSQTVSAFVGLQFAEAQARTAEIWGGIEGAGGMAAMFLAK